MRHFCLRSIKRQESFRSQNDILAKIFEKEGIDFSDEGCRECDSFTRISIIIEIENVFQISIPNELLSSELWENRTKICELVSHLTKSE